MDIYLPTDEHRMLRDTVRAFVVKAVEPQALVHDAEERFNRPLFSQLGEMGLLGITVPEADGGAEMDAVAAVIAHEELSASDPGFCLAYLAHSILCVNNLARNASAAQRKRWLPNLLSGAHVGAMGMSEPGTGTDVLSMKTQAHRQGDGWVVNGRKMWITNGTVDDNKTPCDLMLFYARTGGTAGGPEVSTFVVERGTPGFSVGQKIHGKTGMRASNTAEMVLESCVLPADGLVGEVGARATHAGGDVRRSRAPLRGGDGALRK